MEPFLNDPLPKHALNIFYHNLSFVVLYSIPILGALSFLYSFSIIFAAIGLSFHWNGVAFTLNKLVHLPIELFALALMVVTSFQFRLKFKDRLVFATLAAGLLFISALIEFHL